MLEAGAGHFRRFGHVTLFPSRHIMRTDVVYIY